MNVLHIWKGDLPAVGGGGAGAMYNLHSSLRKAGVDSSIHYLLKNMDSEHLHVIEELSWGWRQAVKWIRRITARLGLNDVHRVSYDRLRRLKILGLQQQAKAIYPFSAVSWTRDAETNKAMPKKPLAIKTKWDRPHGFFARALKSLQRRWLRFWARHANITGLGRIACRLAYHSGPPHTAGVFLADIARCGFFIAPSAIIYHEELFLGNRVFISDRVLIHQARYRGVKGGKIHIADQVRILHDCTLETGQGGTIYIGERTWIHPKCYIIAYNSRVIIGSDVQLAPNCAFYPYDHGIKAGEIIREQALTSKGPIVVENNVWLGFGVIVLSGVCIKSGAVIAAGSVVTKGIPKNAIAAGNPARVIKIRS